MDSKRAMMAATMSATMALWTSPDLLDRFILPFFVVQTQVG